MSHPSYPHELTAEEQQDRYGEAVGKYVLGEITMEELEEEERQDALSTHEELRYLAKLRARRRQSLGDRITQGIMRFLGY
jgi:hypothetical protein